MRLSIVIPAYNVEKHIGVTLESLNAQTQKEFELIVVDDGSTDNTLKVAQDILSKGPLHNYKIIKKKNEGVSAARNRGLEESSGKYVMFLDADDYVSNELVEVIAKYIHKQEYDVICWAFNIVAEDKKPLRNYFCHYDAKFKETTGTEALKKILIDKSMDVCAGSVAYKREFLLECDLKYTEWCIAGEDLEFNYKVLSRAKNIVFINRIYSYYVHRKGSITKSYNIRRFDVIGAMERVCRYIGSLRNPELNEIVKVIGRREILIEYIWVFKSCLGLLRQKGYSRKECIDILLKEIEKEYPGLSQEMLLRMKNYKAHDTDLLIRVKIFLISPFLYALISELERKRRRAKAVIAEWICKPGL